MNNKFLGAVLLVAIGAAHAQTAERPTIIQQQNGNITNVKVEGSLAATQQLDCVDMSAITSSQTPPNIYTGVTKCIQQGNYEKAARLFYIASVYARLDAQRIVDRTARAGGQVLIINTFANFSPDQKTAFGAASNALLQPEQWQAWCSEFRKIGPPTYFPKYLVLHGLNAFSSPKPLENALIADFDMAGTWVKVLNQNVHCPSS